MKCNFPIDYKGNLVFLNGFQSDICFLENHIHNYNNIIIADGAWDGLQETNISSYLEDNVGINTIVIGDADSIINKPQGFIKINNQNYTDFEKIIRYMLDCKISFADIYWSSGGEMDHFLGNLSVAAKYNSSINLRFFDDNHVYFYLDEDCHINGANGKQITVYPFPSCNVTARGLEYEIKNIDLSQNTSQSLRNKAIKKQVTINIKGSAFIFLEI